jgi:excisionase family DNA binding protein
VDATKSPYELLTVKEVARLLRLSELTVYKRIHRGQIPAVRVGGDDRAPLRVPRDELYAMLTENQVASPL